MAEILQDIGLSQLVVHPIQEMKLSTIRHFVEGDEHLGEKAVIDPFARARSKIDDGLDAFEEWLSSL